jgi:hypothetical protein
VIKIALGKGRIVTRLRVRALIGQRRRYRIETENQHRPGRNLDEVTQGVPSIYWRLTIKAHVERPLMAW